MNTSTSTSPRLAWSRRCQGVRARERRARLAQGGCELERYAYFHAFCVWFRVNSARLSGRFILELEQAINRGKNPLDPEGVLAAM